MEKVKRPAVTHNATKVKALLFLEMRKRAGKEMATTREIATAIKGSTRSLYVLLERWTIWGLVIRWDMSPYSYSIGDEGLRYLGKIDDWFFSGYYSKKRKRRVLGYRGKAADLRTEIAVAARAVFYAYDTKRMELFYFEAPFEKTKDFVREPIVDNKYKRWEKDRLLLVRFDSISAAYNAIHDHYGFHRGKAIGQAIVDAGLASWSPGEEKKQ